MSKWEVKQETDYIEFIDDAFAVPGAITFHRSAEPEAGIFNDIVLTPADIVEILDSWEEVARALHLLLD